MFQLGLQEVASRYLSIQFFCKSDLGLGQTSNLSRVEYI